MANRNPVRKPENLRSPWKPGESGNPNGHSRQRRVTDAIHKLIEDQNLAPTIGLVVIAKATGDLKVLGNREPDIDWARLLLLDLLGEGGPIPSESSDDISTLRSHLDSVKRQHHRKPRGAR